MAHTVEIKEIINGVQITETIDTDIVVKLISYQSKPFLRTTNESAEETYQVLDIVGEIYNTPALATDFRIIDKNDNVFIPANGVELIEYSLKIRAFRHDDDRDIFYIGTITTTTNSLTINLPSDDVNWAFIDGSFYEKHYPDTFNFTPVTTGEKILIIHALPDAQVFHLVQGAESTEAVEPAYTGLFVARILVNSTGQVVEEEENDYKLYADDAWRNFSINESGVYTINMANSLASSFSINVAAGVVTPTIGLIKQKAGKSFRDGAEFWIHNISNKDIILYPSAFTDFDVWKHITFAETTIVKAESWAKLKIKYGELVVIEMGGGGGDLTLEQARQNGNVLEGDIEVNQTESIDIDSNHIGIAIKNNNSNSGIFFYKEGGDGSARLYTYNNITGQLTSITPTSTHVEINGDNENFIGLVGNQEYNKQGDRKAFAQLSDVYDIINARTSSVVDQMLHYWDATAGKWLSSGVERVSAGILKVKSIILTTNSGTALPDELGYDGTNVFFGNTKKKIAFLSDIQLYSATQQTVIANSGTTTLNLQRKTQLNLANSNNNSYIITLSTPVQNEVNEYILILKNTGTNPPASITYPAGIKWKGKDPQLTNLATFTFVFEQVFINGAWEVYGIAIGHQL